MHQVFIRRNVLLVLIPILFGPAMLSAQEQWSFWLDEPLANWNKAGAPIPKAPNKLPPLEISRCHPLSRKPATREDRAAAKAGWVLFGAVDTFSGTTIVMGESGVDGMCRPLGYQVFVFVDGHFAGTLSPHPMNSREDGSLQPVELYRPDNLLGRFSRYKESDPLCCPSAVSTVGFEIVRGASGPLVIPKNVDTQPTSPAN
jgi:hypothetical protein